jgi:hypothetical protein
MGCLPNWVTNKDDGEKYFWLEFSVEYKKWKENYSTFITTFNTLYSTSNFDVVNSLVNMSSNYQPIL